MDSSSCPSRGPAPLLLTTNQVDGLYDCLETAMIAFSDIGVSFVIVAGTLLGAVRSQSILFCDDDVDIAIFEDVFRIQ